MANKYRLNNFPPSIFNSRQDIEFIIDFQCCLGYSPRIQKSSIYFRRIFSLSGHVECFAMGTEASLLLAGVPLKPLWFAPLRPLASQYPFEILFLVDILCTGLMFSLTVYKMNKNNNKTQAFFFPFYTENSIFLCLGRHSCLVRPSVLCIPRKLMCWLCTSPRLLVSRSNSFFYKVYFWKLFDSLLNQYPVAW